MRCNPTSVGVLMLELILIPIKSLSGNPKTMPEAKGRRVRSNSSDCFCQRELEWEGNSR